MEAKEISTKDIRDCYFYFDYLTKNNISIDELKKDMTTSECCLLINELIRTHFPEPLDREQFIIRMESQCASKILKISEFSWLDKKNERLCYYVWCHIRNLTNNDVSHICNPNAAIPPNIYPQHASSNIYTALPGRREPTNSLERYQSIIEFFDLWEAGIIIKQTVISQIKGCWNNVYSMKEKYEWLDKKNKKQCDWAWNYLRNEISIPSFFITPFLPSEAHSAVISCLDYWNPISPAEKELFILKMKKSWGQKKHRDKQVDRKPYSFVMHVDINEKLESLAKHHNKRKNEMLEFLINKSFENLPK